MVPGAFGIDNGDRARDADPEAIGFGAVNERLRADEVEFLEPFLEVFPGFAAGLAVAAFGLLRFGAKEDVALILFQPQRFCCVLQFFNVVIPAHLETRAAQPPESPGRVALTKSEVRRSRSLLLPGAFLVAVRAQLLAALMLVNLRLTTLFQ